MAFYKLGNCNITQHCVCFVLGPHAVAPPLSYHNTMLGVCLLAVGETERCDGNMPELFTGSSQCGLCTGVVSMRCEGQEHGSMTEPRSTCMTKAMEG